MALLAGLVGSEGRVIALDRSATAIARTRARLADQAVGDRVVLHQVELAAYEGPSAAVDAALAVNVNVFWTKPGGAECAVLHRVIRPGGRVQLVYEAPSADRTRDIARTVAAALQDHKIDASVVSHPSRPLTAIVGRLPGRPRASTHA